MDSQHQQQDTEHCEEHSSRSQKNCCLDCGIDMGDCNPRQLCGKWRCLFAEDDDENVAND